MDNTGFRRKVTELNLHFFVSSRRRHTRFSRDWSSDVCSSDLAKLISFNNNKEVILDSTTVVDGKLTLKGNVDCPDLHYLAIDGLAGFMPIMVENEKMEVTLYKDSLQRYLVKGSKDNDHLKIYHDDSEMLKMKNAKFGR